MPASDIFRKISPLLAFKTRSTPSLIHSVLVYKLCSNETLTSLGSSGLASFQKNSNISELLNGIVKAGVKGTLFKQFIGGESEGEAVDTLKRLSLSNIGAVLDLAIEQDIISSEQSIDYPVMINLLKRCIEASSKGHIKPMVALKVTALISPQTLERLNAIFEQENILPKDMLSTKAITDADRKELSDLMDRLAVLIDYAKHLNVTVMIDAEQTYFQTAISHVTHKLMAKYNTTSLTVMNTVQMYLKSGASRLENDLQFAKDGGYGYGVKLVRGAYMIAERARAEKYGLTDPIHSNINDTHNAYDEAANMLIKKNIPLFVASHNQNSIEHALDLLTPSSLVAFGQLLGMSDHLTYTLAQYSTAPTYKYVPYGPLDSVIPYLVRRAQENKAMLAHAGHDSKIIKEVLKQRLKAF